MRTEMDEEAKGTLPLPVQDMVRHMRRSLGSSPASGHKYYVCPLAFRNDRGVSQKAKSALTPREDTSTQRLSSSSSYLLDKQTLQKPTRPTNIDAVVPTGSSSIVSVARQPVPFHDQTGFSMVRVYSSSKCSRTNLNFASENWGQGDRKQRSTTLVQVSSDNTGHQTAAKCLPVEFSVAANLQHDKSVTMKHLSSHPASVESESVISPRAVMIPCDSQCHSSKEDFICHAASECSNGTDIRYMLSETGYAAAASPQTQEPIDSATVSTDACQKQVPIDSATFYTDVCQKQEPIDSATVSTDVCQKQTSVAAHILENLDSFRTHFPQRASQPQIGIAAVIKSTVDSRQDKAAQQMIIKFHSLEQLKLVGITPAPSELESEDFSCTKVNHIPLQMRTSSNQIEPLSSSRVDHVPLQMRTSSNQIEPLSSSRFDHVPLQMRTSSNQIEPLSSSRVDHVPLQMRTSSNQIEPLSSSRVDHVPLQMRTSSNQIEPLSSSRVDHVPLQMRTSSNQIEPLSSSRVTEWSHVSISQTEKPHPETLEESTDEKWKEVKNFLGSPEYETPVKRRKRADSGSSGHMSDDDCCVGDDLSSSFGDKDDDSDDDFSDIDADLADIKPSECESLVALGKKQKQYFWQYNIQAKGPKGSRLKLAVESPSDPHVLNDFEDPVFDQCNTAIAGIRHGGKARKGDGNEITPNPKKLFMIGHQLLRLSHQINACQLGTDVPLVKRNEARKEKNKLASRACRLKKKAQHEANKIKLYGLEQEHCQLNSVLQFIWPHIHEKAKSLMANIDKPAPLTHLLEAQISRNLKSMIAGHTVDYVNSVILKVESGDYNGGLKIKRSHKA